MTNNEVCEKHINESHCWHLVGTTTVFRSEKGYDKLMTPAECCHCKKIAYQWEKITLAHFDGPAQYISYEAGDKK